MAEDDGEQTAIEQQLEHAISSRIQHFKDQADSLTMESVRRLLEKDLGFEKFALDAHKRFIRLYLEKKMDAGDEYSTKTESENTDKDACLNKEGAATSPKLHDTKSNLKKSSSGDEEMLEDSPIMGILTPKSEADTKASPVSESGIKKAIWKRADYFLANSENITLAGVRRLLEEDLGVAKNTLDTYKKFISQEIDQVLNPPKVEKPMKDIKKKNSENSRSKKSKESSCDESNSSGSESDNEMEDKVKSRKKPASRRNVKKVEPTKKRKTSEREIDGSGKGSKSVKRQKGEDNESDADGSLSEGGQFQSNEKSTQRKDKSTPAYGKQVERLKSIIKACGMSVAPVIYKKAKQVPENKREAFIVKELEDILSKEGLSSNPNEKEIKDCKKRKETARELEGIDMSNILSSSRRRSTFSFTTPVKPVIHAKKDKVAAKESKIKDSDDKGQNNDNEEDEKDEENEKKNEKVEEKQEDEKEEGEGDDEEEEGEEEDNADDAEEDSEEDEEESSESEEFNEDDSD